MNSVEGRGIFEAKCPDATSRRDWLRCLTAYAASGVLLSSGCRRTAQPASTLQANQASKPSIEGQKPQVIQTRDLPLDSKELQDLLLELRRQQHVEGPVRNFNFSSGGQYSTKEDSLRVAYYDLGVRVEHEGKFYILLKEDFYLPDASKQFRYIGSQYIPSTTYYTPTNFRKPTARETTLQWSTAQVQRDGFVGIEAPYLEGKEPARIVTEDYAMDSPDLDAFLGAYRKRPQQEGPLDDFSTDIDVQSEDTEAASVFYFNRKARVVTAKGECFLTAKRDTYTPRGENRKLSYIGSDFIVTNAYYSPKGFRSPSSSAESFQSIDEWAKKHGFDGVESGLLQKE